MDKSYYGVKTMDKVTTLNILTDFLRAIPRDKYALSKAYLFGSYARNNQHEESDIDLALVICKFQLKSIPVFQLGKNTT